MARVKRGTTKLKHRRSVLARTKGYRLGLSKKERLAQEAMRHAGKHAFQHRRKKKGDFRRLWNVRLNAAVREHDLSYSKFIALLKAKNILLNRKVLSEVAANTPEAFVSIVAEAKR